MKFAHAISVCIIAMAFAGSASGAETAPEIAPEVPETVMEGATDFETESFLQADVNADLKLEYPEFREFIGKLAKADHSSAKWVQGLHLYSLAFSVMDKNEDGFVDPAELAEGQAEHGK